MFVQSAKKGKKNENQQNRPDNNNSIPLHFLLPNEARGQPAAAATALYALQVLFPIHDDCQTTALVVDSSSSSSCPVPITAITVRRSHHRSDNCHPAQQQQHRATIIRRGGGQRVLKRQQWQQQQQPSQCFMFELSSEVHCSRIHRAENRKSRRRKKDGHRYTAGHELTVCLTD